MQCGPNSVALRVPLQLGAGAGGFHRCSPAVDAAYGIPRNVCTVPCILPSTIPVSIFTCGPGSCVRVGGAQANANANTAQVYIATASTLLRNDVHISPLWKIFARLILEID